KAPGGERLLGLRAEIRRAALDARRRAAEPGGRTRLHNPIHINEALARLVVRMRSGLPEREHGGEAGFASFHDLAPFVAALLPERLGETLAHFRPAFPVKLIRQARRIEIE